MFLESVIEGSVKRNSVEVNRSLLIDESKLYTVKDSVLSLVEIQPVHFNQRTVIVSGLKDGELIISRMVPGAYEGMKVQVYNAN